MTRIRLLAAAAVVGIVALIGSYYLFGGPLNLSMYFRITQSVETKYARIPDLRLPASPPPLGRGLPKPTVTPTMRPHPSMRVSTRTDAILHYSPKPLSYSPTLAPVTPPPAPSYQPVTPPPYGQTMPPVIMPHAGIPLPGLASPLPSDSPSPSSTP
jgi:hypothetical protein